MKIKGSLYHQTLIHPDMISQNNKNKTFLLFISLNNYYSLI